MAINNLGSPKQPTSISENKINKTNDRPQAKESSKNNDIRISAAEIFGSVPLKVSQEEQNINQNLKNQIPAVESCNSSVEGCRSSVESCRGSAYT